MCSSRLVNVFSGNLWSCLKEVKQFVVFDGERGMAPETMQGNQTTSRLDLGHTDLFPVGAVTSGSLETCDSVLVDTVSFHQGSQGFFRV